MDTNIIYIITNRMNGKSYIGKTSKSLELRWKQHMWSSVRCDTNSLLHKAIRKYGGDKFTMSVLEEVSDKEGNQMEEKYILLRNTLPPNGYNLTKGGEGGDLTQVLADLSKQELTLADAQVLVGERARTSLLVLTDNIEKLPVINTI